MALRSIITPEGSTIHIDVRRGASDDRWSAWRTAQAIFEELSTSPPGGGTVYPPYGSEGQTESYVPPARANITLPQVIIKQQYGSVSKCSVVDYRERATLIRQVEEIVSQHTLHVDTLPALNWCLEGQFPARHPRLGEPGDYERAVREFAPRERARAELLQPFLAGNYPVKLPELFGEFNLELSPLERAVVVASFDGSVHALSVRNVLSEGRADLSLMTAMWTSLTKRLIALDWLSEAKSYPFDDPAWLPRVRRGPKSKLLPGGQHLI
jgi:hypothetical protein